jgi:hypothetical protein
MRTNSAVKDRSWVAEITGTDAKYGLRRTFLKRSVKQEHNQDGIQTFAPLFNGEVYEYRAIMRDGESAYHYRKESGGMSGFFQLVDGEIIEWEKKDVEIWAIMRGNSTASTDGPRLKVLA